ncbi:ATP-binding protein [Clostridium beijerinckii]|uniref:Uncharacterized protein n=1 Tax=Clostridium beijerinckii TaxID=1520 RepID=A0AAE5H081_CLOBE|nr:ATP-binding protein [Clostridium beijerinckii]NSB12152.1 hypothetical protein [Clostridium beijerinckii]OOM23047.1 hypothetical protein CLOBE_42080 [Clostridium beijerinckii]
MSFYNDWGFWDEPFSYKPLEGDEIGENLLVGREGEKKKLKLRLRQTDKICTVEGEIGIGKTSLANVVLFECYNEWAEDTTTNPILIPCKLKFQLKEALDIDEFRKMVIVELAQVIIKYKKILNESGLYNGKEFEKFFNSESLNAVSIGASIMGFGGNASQEKSLNNSKVFQDEIFYKLVEQALFEMSEKAYMGGIVCLIDNVELVNTHVKARELIELMRDKIFNIPFTKWVLCGEKDIFMSIIESPRMSAYIHKPILVNKLQANVASKMFSTRYDFYGGNYLPCSDKEFDSLFRIFDGNTRDIFECIDEYCYEIYESDELPDYEHDKEECFGRWLNKITIDYIKATINVMEPKHFNLLFKLCKSKTLKIEKFKSMCNLDDEIDSFINIAKQHHFIKTYDDGTFKYLRKGYIMRYHFSTFSSFSELKEDLENTYDIFIKKSTTNLK